MQQRILYIEDKLGITQGYQNLFASLLLGCGISPAQVYPFSLYKKQNMPQLLTRYKNRKVPSFNPDQHAQSIIQATVESAVRTVKPSLIICTDPACLFMLVPEQAIATIDNLRGGVYKLFGITCLVTIPISAWHRQVKEKDIARLNDGFSDKDAWEQAHENESDDNDGPDDSDDEHDGAVWVEPVVIPFGQFVLKKDFGKAKRILDNVT